MKTSLLKATPPRRLQGFSVAILCLALLCLAALPALAVSYNDLPKPLQGTYKVKSVKVVMNGQAQPSPKPASTPFAIGPSGLEAVNAATISKMILAGGGGNQTKVKITYAATTNSNGTLTGKVGKEGNVAIKTGTYKASLSTSGLVVNLSVTGTSGQGATKMTVGITLKK